MSLTHGLWKYETWGYPVENAAPGAEVLAWFEDDSGISEEEIDRQWKELCGTLSGLLCASFSFIDQTNTMKPKFSFRPQFNLKNDFNSTFLRYGTLPHEIVCTENLTPWKKLLPCNSKDGFASLLNADKIYSSNYHSIGIHVRTICDPDNVRECSSTSLEVKQNVNLVFDPILIGGRDWSIRKLFGQGLNGACPLAKSSKVYLDVTDADFDVTPTPAEVIKSIRGGSQIKLFEYDIQKLSPNKMFNLAVVQNDKNPAISLLSPPPLYAKRYILGIGQERGQIVTKITNTHWASINTIVLENIPWFVPIYLHTMTIKNGNQVIRPDSINYIPGKQRERPYHLEVAFKIPARSSIELSIDFDYIFLKWLEYPPDANHGHYIGSAVISAILPIGRNYTSIPVDGNLFSDSFNASRSGYFTQIRTESLLITLPTPDFSMPYNVICLACTVVALAFGPLHNMATKSLVLQSKEAPSGFLGKLKAKLFKKKIE